MSPENCPQCGKKLAPPFKSSGRQVCSGCGWTNKPKIVKPEAVSKFIPISESEESKKQPVGVFLATGFVGMVLYQIPFSRPIYNREVRRRKKQCREKFL